MFIRLLVAAAILLSVTYGVSSASVAVDLVDTSVTVENATLVDNSTKSLNVSGANFLKIRDVIEIAKLGPMCQCLCTNVTDVDVQIKSVPRLDSSTDSSLKSDSESHFFEVRAVRQESGANVSDVNLAARNGSQFGNSTEEALDGKENNVTDGAILSPRDVDVKLLKLEANVSDVSAANSTVNSTDDWAFLKSLEERAVDDSTLDEDIMGDAANISNITSMILDFVFDTKPSVSQANVSSLIVDRGISQDVEGSDDTGFDESDMDLEGLVLLKNESNNSTANANSTLSIDVKESEITSDE